MATLPAENDWVTVKEPNEPPFDAMVVKVNRKGVKVKYVPGEPHANLLHHPHLVERFVKKENVHPCSFQ